MHPVRYGSCQLRDIELEPDDIDVFSLRSPLTIGKVRLARQKKIRHAVIRLASLAPLMTCRVLTSHSEIQCGRP
jgi:hypothetical protein